MAVLSNTELKKTKGRLLYAVIIAVLVIGLPLQVFPYYWMFTNSFKTDLEIIRLPPTIIPQQWFLDGFAQTFERYHLWDNIKNTFILCGAIMLIQITSSGLAAFSLSKLGPKFRNQILLFFLGTMMISGQALMFPTYLMMSDLPLLHINLINNFWSYILTSSAWGYTLFLFKGFFDGLPNELIEAAKIDGASSITTFTRIVLPLSKPVIAVNVLTTFMAVYNDFLFPMMLLPSDRNWTITIRIYSAQWSSATWNSVMVMLTVATIPVILVYLLAQKRVVQGISMTGLKG